jgi:hypothetical protein
MTLAQRKEAQRTLEERGIRSQSAERKTKRGEVR